MRTLRAVLGQIRYQSTVAGRNRLLVFFSIALPVLLFFLFQFVINGTVTADGQIYTVPQFFGPSIASYAVATGTYGYLAMNTAATRQEGILKRLRGTPLSASVYMTGRIGSAIAGGAVASGLVLAIAVLFYDLHVAAVAIPAIAVTFLVGAVAFGALGLAVAAFASNGDAAVAIVERDAAPGRVRLLGVRAARQPVDARAGARVVAAVETVHARVPARRARRLVRRRVRLGPAARGRVLGHRGRVPRAPLLHMGAEAPAGSAPVDTALGPAAGHGSVGPNLTLSEQPAVARRHEAIAVATPVVDAVFGDGKEVAAGRRFVRAGHVDAQVRRVVPDHRHRRGVPQIGADAGEERPQPVVAARGLARP